MLNLADCTEALGHALLNIQASGYYFVLVMESFCFFTQ